MVLYLMRHGAAASAEPGRGDLSRTLTPEGIEQVKRLAAALKRAGVRVDRLFASPLMRARQTAALVATALGVAPEQDDLLKPGCTLDDLAELAGRLDEAACVLCVGHQPDLGALVQQLTGGRVTLRPGALAAVEAPSLAPGQGVLLGLYDPAVLAPAQP